MNVAAQGGHANAHGDAYATHFAHRGPAFGLDALADAFGRGPGSCSVGARHGQHKLFAAVAAHQVVIAGAFAELARRLLNHPVADAVAMGVVHPLEMVDVQHQAAQGRTVALRHRKQAFIGLVEGAPVQAAGERVARGQPDQLFVFLVHLCVRFGQLGQRLLQRLVGMVQRAQVGDADQAAAQLGAAVLDGHGVDQQLLALVLDVGNFNRQPRHRRARLQGANPRVVGHTVGYAPGQPGLLRHGLAHMHGLGQRVQASKRLVGHQQPAFGVQHHHALVHHVERALHALGNHRPRVQVLQRPAQVHANEGRAQQRDRQQHRHQRLAQPAQPHRPGVRRVDHLQPAPAAATGVHGHDHMVQAGRVVVHVGQGLGGYARLHQHRAVGAAQQHGLGRHALVQVLHGLAQQLLLVVAQQAGDLRRHAFGKLAALLQLHLRMVGKRAQQRIGQQDQQAADRDQRRGQARQRAQRPGPPAKGFELGEFHQHAIKRVGARTGHPG